MKLVHFDIECYMWFWLHIGNVWLWEEATEIVQTCGKLFRNTPKLGYCKYIESQGSLHQGLRNKFKNQGLLKEN